MLLLDIRDHLVTTIGTLNPGISYARLKNLVTSLGGDSIRTWVNMARCVARSACKAHGLLHGGIMSFPDTHYPLSWSAVGCWSPI